MTRALALARALAERRSDLELIVSTEIPEERIARELSGIRFRYRKTGYEPGAAQRSCFETDIDATRAAYRRFFESYDERLREEVRFLEETRPIAVVADIPALPIRAAAETSLPAIGVSNFTWDWILEPMVDGTDDAWIVERLASDYRSGTIYYRLPLGASTAPFPRLEAAPLVGRRARLPRERTREILDLSDRPTRPVALVCPGGWSAEGWGRIRVEDPGEFAFILVGDLPIDVDAPAIRLPHRLPEGVTFPDLVAASDVVLTKPGYGIASECILNRTPCAGIERRGFREAPDLVLGLRAAGPSSEITLDDFFAGRWRESLEQAIEDATPWAPVPDDGAGELAASIARILELD